MKALIFSVLLATVGVQASDYQTFFQNFRGTWRGESTVMITDAPGKELKFPVSVFMSTFGENVDSKNWRLVYLREREPQEYSRSITYFHGSTNRFHIVSDTCYNARVSVGEVTENSFVYSLRTKNRWDDYYLTCTTKVHVSGNELLVELNQSYKGEVVSIETIRAKKE